MKKFLPGIALTILSVGAAQAQSTFTSVYNLFQANCTVGCHSGSSPSANLDLDENGDKTAVYNNLVEVTPVNPAAAAKGHKLVDPGYPYRSFLLRKCGYSNWDPTVSIDQPEGNQMPDGQPVLEKEEVELIRQWILYGAPFNGQVVSTQLLYDYYHVNGKAQMPKPVEPDPSEGYQIRTGPFFLQPGQEVEYYRKYETEGPAQEVHRIDDIINDESHHYLLFQFEPGSANQLGDGLRKVDVSNVFPDETKYLTGWVDSDSTILPSGTAYKIHENAVYDLNYHIINYNTDSILQADAYVNIYTQPNGTADKEMHSELVIYTPQFLIIPTDGSEYTFNSTLSASNPNGLDVNQNDVWNIWFLSSHTHKYGTAYTIMKRNANGSRGDTLYDGRYNTNYTFNQGYYDWAHPANRYFDPMVSVDMNNGIIQEAKYRVNDPQNHGFFPVTFGLTTEDEMMLYFIQYTVGAEPVDTTGTISIAENELSENELAVYPNPYTESTVIKYNLSASSDVRLDIYNAVGARVAQLVNQQQSSGTYSYQLSSSEFKLPAGIYYVNLQVGDKLSSKKIIQLH